MRTSRNRKVAPREPLGKNPGAFACQGARRASLTAALSASRQLAARRAPAQQAGGSRVAPKRASIALSGALERHAVDAGRQPPHRALSARKDHIRLEDVIEVGVPATMLVENRELPSAVDIRPEVLIGHLLELGAWGFALMIIARVGACLFVSLSTQQASALFQLDDIHPQSNDLDRFASKKGATRRPISFVR